MKESGKILPSLLTLHLGEYFAAQKGPKMLANLAKAAILTEFRQGCRRKFSTEHIKSQCPQIWTKQRHKSKNRFRSNFPHRLALASKQTDHS